MTTPRSLNHFWEKYYIYLIQRFPFSKSVLSISATQLFRLLDRYRPESRQEKKIRLRLRAEERAKGKPDAPTKRPPIVRSGVNTVTTLVEQKKAQLVIIAHDIDPVEVSCLYYKYTSAWN